MATPPQTAPASTPMQCAQPIPITKQGAAQSISAADLPRPPEPIDYNSIRREDGQGSIFTPVSSCWGPLRSNPIGGTDEALVLDAMVNDLNNVTTKSAAHLEMLQIADGTADEDEATG